MIISYKMLNRQEEQETMNVDISGMNMQNNCPSSQHAKIPSD